MTASRAQRIVEAAAAALRVPPMASLAPERVYLDLVGALQSQQLPAIVIEAGGEGPASRGVIGLKLRTLELRVTTFGMSYQQADAPMVEAMSRLLADPSLAGLAIECDEGVVVREREDAERSRVAVTRVLSYQYRTTEGSIV